MAFLEALIAQNFADDEADPPSGALGALTPGEERDIPNASGVSLGPPKWVPLNSKKGGPMEFPLPKTKQESPAADAVPAAAAPAAAAPAAAAAKFEQQSTPAAAPAENSIDGVPVMKYDSLFAFSDNAKDDWEAVRNVPRIRHKKEAGPPSASEGGALPADGRSRRLALLQALPKPQGAPSGCLGTLGSSSGLELRIQEAGDNAAAATTAAGDAALQMMPRVLQQKRRPEAKVEKDGPGAPEGPPSAAEKDEAGVEKQQPEATPAAAATAEEAAEGDGFLTSMFTLYESDGEEEVTKEAPSSSSSSCSSSSSSSSSAEVEAAKVVKFPEAAAAPEAREAAATAAAAAAVPKPQPGRAWVTEGDQEVLEELGIDAALLQGSGISSAELRDLRRMGTTTVTGATLQNPDWHLTAQSGPQAKKAKLRLATKVWSAKEGAITETLEPKTMQKRKHQINWLAAEAHEKELEMLEMTARTRQTKYQTAMKYGW